jgi:hypothetical protein
MYYKLKGWYFNKVYFGRLGAAIHVLLGKPLIYRVHLIGKFKVSDEHNNNDTWMVNNMIEYKD